MFTITLLSPDQLVLSNDTKDVVVSASVVLSLNTLNAKIVPISIIKIQ